MKRDADKIINDYREAYTKASGRMAPIITLRNKRGGWYDARDGLMSHAVQLCTLERWTRQLLFTIRERDRKQQESAQ